MAKGLTPLQARFVGEYLKDLNARAAYQRAGYTARGNVAEAAASRLLRNVNVAAAIQHATAKRSKRTEIAVDKVLLEAARLAFSDIRDYVTWGPDGVALKASEELSEDAARAVQEVISTTRTRTFAHAAGETSTTVEVQTRVKLYSKQAALRDLMEHLQLFAKDRAFDETFLVGFVEVVKQHAQSGETRQALLGYLRNYISRSAV